MACGNDNVAAQIKSRCFLNQTKSAAIAILLNLIAARLGLVDPYRLLTRVWSTRKHAIPLIIIFCFFLDFVCVFSGILFNIFQMLFDSSHFLALIRLCIVARIDIDIDDIDIDIDATTDGHDCRATEPTACG